MATENMGATDDFDFMGYMLCTRPDGQSEWQPCSDSLAEWDDLVALAIQEAWGGKQVAYLEEETGKILELDSLRLTDALVKLKALDDMIKSKGIEGHSIAYDGAAKKVLVRSGSGDVACSGDFAVCKEYLKNL
jgi:hypothetical protein